MGYSMTLSKIQEVLASTVTKADELGTALDGVEQIVTTAITGSGSSAIIADAVSVFFENRKATLQGIGTRMQAAMNGTIAAVGWYQAGDEEMVLSQQRLTSKVATTGRFDQFVGAPQ